MIKKRNENCIFFYVNFVVKTKYYAILDYKSWSNMLQWLLEKP